MNRESIARSYWMQVFELMKLNHGLMASHLIGNLGFLCVMGVSCAVCAFVLFSAIFRAMESIGHGMLFLF